jgi:predicted N-acetyltransferase YhbS
MKSDEVHIREAEEKDRGEILNLLNSVFAENQRSSTQRDNDYWQWKFRSNVFGKSIISIAETDNKIVGIDHFWPWLLEYNGESIQAYQPCDSAVALRYRGKGIFKKLRLQGIQEARKREGRLLFNFPNSNSLPVNIQVGAKELGQIIWWVRVLEPINMVRGKLGNTRSESADIDKAFSMDIDKLYSISKDCESFGHFLSISRPSGFYEWRYQNRPNRQYGMVSVEREKKMIAGIFTMNQKGVSREMVLVDILGDPGLSEYLFKKIVKAAKEQEVTFLALMDNHKFNTNQLWKKGFIKKKMKNMVVYPIDLSIESEVTNLADWSLLAGMHDSI